MPPLLKKTSQLQVIMVLRCIAITIQILLILFVNLGLAYSLPWTPLISVISLELVFTIASYFYYRNHHLTEKQSNQKAILIQICADIVFLSLILFFSGGATNAFVSLLLIPIAIAAVTLRRALLVGVALLAITSYSILLWSLPMHVMHGNMQGHFIAMGINFLFSALVVAIVVGKMARSINKQELAISTYRENLLKQEQITALGVASAQVTHQLATPIATVQLLADELSEDYPDNDIITDMQSQLIRCKESFSEFRAMVFEIKEQTIKTIDCQVLFNDIIEHVQINYPDINITLPKNSPEHINENATINANTALLPAILNLINNAIRASKNNNSSDICLTREITGNTWQLVIRDYGKGFNLHELSNLGVNPVSSEQGLGMAVFLSHSSLEGIGGKLALTNHKEGGALVTISLPIVTGHLSSKKVT